MATEEFVWTEKHRPDSLDDVIGHEDKINRMKKWVDDPSCPHVLLKGPAGTGKTASLVGFAKDKYGDDWRSNLIQMNASDERGIDVVREQIKKQAQEAASGEHSFKIIYLDEADALTKDAQNALRRTMERFTDQTRFFLSCNYANKLIDPIQSRCVTLPFNRLSDDEITELVARILEKEEIEYEESAVEKIVEHCSGDARRAVHSLQTSVEDGELTEAVLDIVNATVDEETVEEMLSLAANGNVDDARLMNVREVQPEVVDHSGFAKRVDRVLSRTDELEDDVRFYAMSQLGETEMNVLEGANPVVQWNSFLALLPVINHASVPNYGDDR